MIIHGYNPDVLKADTSLESPFWLLMANLRKKTANIHNLRKMF